MFGENHSSSEFLVIVCERKQFEYICDSFNMLLELIVFPQMIFNDFEFVSSKPEKQISRIYIDINNIDI